MKKASIKNARRRRPARSVPRPVKWFGVTAGVALLVYGASQMSGVAYTDADIRVVDFSALTSREKRGALQAANRARCSCGCGMNLAQCVATDSTCPLRDRNIQSIKAIVQEAGQP